MASRADMSSMFPLRCQKCMAPFPDSRALYVHQHAEGHFGCSYCKKTFHNIDSLFSHQTENHSGDQDLHCPGCRKNFSTAGGWMHHVERGDCSGIFPSDLAQGVSNVMDSVTRDLRQIGISRQRNVNYSGPSHIKDVWGEEWNKEQSLDVRQNPDRFPRTARQEFYRGGSKLPDLLTGDDADDPEQHPWNAWTEKKDLFPEKNAHHRVPSPPSLQENTSQPAPPSRPTGQRILDPNHPEFNVALFKDPILETFKCPHKSCNSKFKSSKGLIAHLKSSVHSGNQFRCPGCRNIFTSGASWVQHAETVSISRCRIRSLKIYGEALNTISNGALNVDTLSKLTNNTGNIKFDEGWAGSKQRSKPNLVPGSAEWAKFKQAEAARSTPSPEDEDVPEEDPW